MILNTISHPPLRYHGSKFRIAKWIISLFPPHTAYVEVYGGGASVLLQKSPSTYEIYNDLDSQVVGFFKILREQPQMLIDAIRFTPYSRAEWRLAWDDLGAPGTLEGARRFYIRSHQSYSNATVQDNPTWRFGKSARSDRKLGGISPIPSWNRVEHLYAVANRLKDVHIECDDALTVLKRTDGTKTLFYVDPPYVFDTRERERDDYAHEMTDADHVKLAETLNSLKGMIMVSGYDCPLYSELYSGWSKVSRSTLTNGGHARIECLWLSPNLGARQLELFAGVHMGGV